MYKTGPYYQGFKAPVARSVLQRDMGPKLIVGVARVREMLPNKIETTPSYIHLIFANIVSITKFLYL
jgi:hypothetical protein